MPLDKLRSFTSDLQGFLVNRDIYNFLESQGHVQVYQQKIKELQSATSVYNKEFDERHNAITPYSMSKFAINQDILLLGFYFSYAFLTIISLIVVYKNAQSWPNVAYAFVMAVAILFVITAMVLRVA